MWASLLLGPHVCCCDVYVHTGVRHDHTVTPICGRHYYWAHILLWCVRSYCTPVWAYTSQHHVGLTTNGPTYCCDVYAHTIHNMCASVGHLLTLTPIVDCMFSVKLSPGIGDDMTGKMAVGAVVSLLNRQTQTKQQISLAISTTVNVKTSYYQCWYNTCFKGY